ncbi:uncharacterized protein LOC128205123 [Mya arenaria]|uniref:uncharacterized protein LOC128205029 n=1 Tax=Mya arenaria TaxID=6604 RepID=UPI0022E3D151|nr:uncharacterized protein LOC128205029 [Mya arenaria]XP_052762519.1 uncharacterized protein LOC128205123 [Mya arenaria]
MANVSLTFLTFAVFACVLVAVLAEVCTVNSDCMATSCLSGSTLICQHPDEGGVTTNGGFCTCSGGGDTSCGGNRTLCFGNLAPNLQCPDSDRHCYDGVCICSRFPIGRR